VRFRRSRTLLVGGAVAVGAMLAVSPAQSPASAASGNPPNIVLIITDDQRIGTLDTMKVVRNQLRDQGAWYTGIIPTSLCCPSRTAILSANHSHTTGVWSNRVLTGGWPVFHSSGYEKRTIATALNRAGYTTGYFGKYLNNWNLAPKGYVPPGWDEFMAMWEPRPGQGAGAYYDYWLRGTESSEYYGRKEGDYSTDVIADKGVDFLKRAGDNPFLLMLATTGPHHPYRPAPRHLSKWAPDEPYDNRAVNERDMSDKPSHLRDAKKVNLERIHKIERRTGQTLRSVDELVGRVLKNVDLSNTLVIYMSDNGVLWGEHRLKDKNMPYRWTTEVPLFMRWDGVIEPGRPSGLVTNADVGATVLDAAGVADAFPTDGDTVLDGTSEISTMEAKTSPDRPSYCGVRTERYLFVEYNSAERELYDYKRDPLELENRANTKRYDDVQHQLKRAAKRLCDPVPGEFTWGR
jgi:arylsulfatase A-like enzyme